MATRVTHQVQRGEQITLTVNQQTVTAYAGETLASILLANGISVFYKTKSGKARGPYCNMGTCFECQVYIDTKNSRGWYRACMTVAENGMHITTGVQKNDL